MNAGRLIIFLLICASLIASVVFSLKSFTGYLVSDIPDINSNLFSFLFLIIGIAASWLYIHNFRKK